jgi:hypothetical protein
MYVCRRKDQSAVERMRYTRAISLGEHSKRVGRNQCFGIYQRSEPVKIKFINRFFYEDVSYLIMFYRTVVSPFSRTYSSSFVNRALVSLLSHKQLSPK